MTNMSRASLYQSYGGKEGLFLAAIAHYAKTRVAGVVAALGPQASLHDDLTAFYAKVVQLATADPETLGCLISCVLADVAGRNDVFRAELDRRFMAIELHLADRFRHNGWTDAAPVPPAAAAGLAAAAARGIMLRARSGQTPAELTAIGNAAVTALVQLSA